MNTLNSLVMGSGGGTSWSYVLLTIAVLWSLPWKGVALYKAARLSHKKWFIVLLILNTFGILEIIYIYFVARKYKVETEETNETKTVTEVK